MMSMESRMAKSEQNLNNMSHKTKERHQTNNVLTFPGRLSPQINNQGDIYETSVRRWSSMTRF